MNTYTYCNITHNSQAMETDKDEGVIKLNILGEHAQTTFTCK
jgi:hypothetical protein